PVGEGPYCVGKGGLNTLSRMCALEGAPHNIRANTIALGVVGDTRWALANPAVAEQALEETPLRRHADCADVAEAALFLASDRGRQMPGEIPCITGGFYMRS